MIKNTFGITLEKLTNFGKNLIIKFKVPNSNWRNYLKIKKLRIKLATFIIIKKKR